MPLAAQVPGVPKYVSSLSVTGLVPGIVNAKRSMSVAAGTRLPLICAVEGTPANAGMVPVGPPQVPFGSTSQPASIWQTDEQQSLLARLPSSHASLGAFTPSPQTEVQTLGVPVHVYPGSTAHTAEQPSPVVVLPSSQASAPFLSPSPQIGEQTLGTPAQLKPASTTHAEEQPSPLVVLLSSQASTPFLRPSPQIGAQTLGEPAQA